MMNAVAAEPLIWASRPQPTFAANDNTPGLIIDLFAGGGGASTAMKWATGREPDLAVNHNQDAVGLHKANHPKTLHLCEDIRQVNPAETLLVHFPGRKVDLLWASPDCRHHSKASGASLKDRGIRGLAWEVVRWAASIKRATGAFPSIICLENVEEFEDWGPVHRYGKNAGKAMKARKRELFNLWVGQLRKLGYQVEWRHVIAADFGAPTTRKRLFLVARCDGVPIRWPGRQFASRAEIAAALNPKAPKVRRRAQLDLFGDEPPVPETPAIDLRGMPMWRAAAEIIDWSLRCPSIFGRKKRLAPKTHARIAKGIRRYVIEAARPFLVNVNHSTAKSGKVYDPDEPLRTATAAKGGNFQVISPSVLPVTHAGGEERVYGPEDPLRTVTAANRGEIAAAAAYLVPRYGEREGQAPRTLDVRAPYPTVVPGQNGGDVVSAFMNRTDMQSATRAGVRSANDPMATATSGGGIATTAVHLIRQFGTAEGRDLGRPHPTVMTDGAGGKSGIVATHMLKMNFGDKPFSGSDEPVHTVVAQGKTHAMVAAHLSSVAYGDDRPRAGLRAASVDAPVGTVTGANDKTVVAAHLSRQFGKSVGSDQGEPVGTITAGGGGKTQQVAAYMAQHNFDRVGRSAEEPVTALTHRSTQQQIVAPVIDKYYATGVAADPTEPLDTTTTKSRFGLASAFLEQANTGMVGHDMRSTMPTIVAGGSDSGWGTTQRLIETQLEQPAAPEPNRRQDVLEFLWEHFGQPTAEEMADPLATAEGRLKFGLVVIDDTVWQIVDIGMRMLEPRELYNAQGFPADYIIDVTWEGKKLTKTAQTKMAGNSVSPPPAAAILRENLPHRMLGWESVNMRMAA